MRWKTALALLLLIAPLAVAEDWPQWLGPRRDGSTTDGISPWKGELKKLWSVPVTEGHSSPIVASGKVYIHGSPAGKDQEVIECFAADTGKKLWSFEYDRGPFAGLFGRGPRGTPVVTEGKLIAFGATGIVTCLDAEKGEKIWQVDTKKEYKAPDLKFGASASPLVVGKQVVIQVGAKGAGLVAFDLATGKEVWKSLDDPASYAAPILRHDGSEMLIVCLTQKGLVGVSPKDGKLRWSFPFVDKLAESSTTPVRVADKIFISSITLGSALVTPEAGGKVKQEWFNKDLTCYFSTPVVMGEHIYVVTGALSISPSASLHCVEAKTGKVVWTREKVGKYHACLMNTSNDKLLLIEEAGNVVMLEPSPKGYQELCRARVSGETWAHPALANGRLFIRDKKDLICVGIHQ